MSTEIALCRRDELAPGSARRFDVEGYRIALVRIEEEFFALDDRCSHEDYSLAEGEVLADECAIECPRHGSSFDLRDGSAQSLPAVNPVNVYEVRLSGDQIAVVVP